MSKKCPEDKILNPRTGRCVKMDGKIGRKLNQEHKSSLTGTGKISKKCPEDKILNPRTGRCVKMDGKIGRKLNQEHKSSIISKTTEPIVDVKDIKFNSKTGVYYELSNFYGGVEHCYMEDRFKNKEIKNLIKKFGTVGKDEFLMYLKLLQPDKKDWNIRKLNYWFKGDLPITGILSKLAGGSVKDNRSSKKRLKILGDIAGVKGEIELSPNKSNDEKIELMKRCLRKKYKNAYYKKLLLSTGSANLHEIPMRGKGDFWTVGGEDTLGKLLMIIREEIKSKR